MKIEIERKFLVKDQVWRNLTKEVKFIKQGYLSSCESRVVRIRTVDDKAFITVKGLATENSRKEFEYELPFTDANIMLEELCEKPLIEKNRHKIEAVDFIWEVDEFFAENKGLIVAEVELDSIDKEIIIPPWIGEEVSKDWKYSNSNLLKNPYCNW